jgi:hypothetical protein
LRPAIRIVLICLAVGMAVPHGRRKPCISRCCTATRAFFAYEIDVFRLALEKSGYDAPLDIIPLTRGLHEAYIEVAEQGDRDGAQQEC